MTDEKQSTYQCMSEAAMTAGFSLPPIAPGAVASLAVTQETLGRRGHIQRTEVVGSYPGADGATHSFSTQETRPASALPHVPSDATFLANQRVNNGALDAAVVTASVTRSPLADGTGGAHDTSVVAADPATGAGVQPNNIPATLRKLLGCIPTS